jgi:hypothetical protein
MPWKLKDWEATIEKIVSESNQARKRSAKQKVLDDWRTQLQKEPALLKAYQIDVIVREVQRRLKGNAN